MNGFLILNKQQNISSFSAARMARNHLGELGEKKVGHTGTLDPMATGVLVVALGRATTFIELLDSSARKKYRASFVLGIQTDTLDVTGNILEKKNAEVPREDVFDCIRSFVGTSLQLPPMYSAIKVGGQKLYELARKGIEVERERREITIYDIYDLDETDGEYSFTVECSKGTYIRSLISDIGEKLGTCACMSKLERQSSDGFDIEQSVTPRQIDDCEDKSKLIIPVDKVFEKLERVDLTQGKSFRFQNGAEIGQADEMNTTDNGKLVRVYDDTGDFLGIGQYENGCLKVKKLYKIL